MRGVATKKRQSLKEYPDLPKIDWFTFISRVRVRWAHGVMPASFALPQANEVEGTEGFYRKQSTMKDKKVMPKPAKKSGKGGEKSGKKSCK